ncbi:hypothetical protein EZY14_000245 [Kordia sp. TARA_039_SRF]|jgi:hypothetical protein|nr:hypothetical protein EZY14_000245 [Kordia sp. TARA_039_SRF]
MKKKNLKTLKLKKASISRLSGGAQEPIPVPLTRNIRDCVFTRNIRDCTWYSELYTACECEPSWDLGCQQSIDIPCPI